MRLPARLRTAGLASALVARVGWGALPSGPLGPGFSLAQTAASATATLAAPGRALATLERVDERTAIDAVTRAQVSLPPDAELAPAAPRPPAPAAPVASLPRGSVAGKAGDAAPRSLEKAARRTLAEGYVACFSSNDAWPFDLATLAVAPRIDLAPEGSYPYDAAIDPTGAEVWHVAAGGDHVLVIDRATDTIVRRIPVGRYPVGIAFSADGTLAFVSSRDDHRIDVLDTASYAVMRSLPFPGTQQPGKIAVDPVSRLVYVAEWYGPRVYELDEAATAILRAPSLGDSHWMIAVSPDGAHLYVTERDPALHLVRDLDRATLTELRTLVVGSDPWGLDVSADGATLAVASEDDDSVQVIDVASWTSRSLTLPTSDGPQDLDIEDATGRAFIAAGREGTVPGVGAVVYAVDLAAAAVSDRIPVGGYKTSVIAVQPAGPAPAGCPPALAPVGPIRGAKSADDVRFSWPAVARAETYNLWRVGDRRQLPIATSPPGPGVTGICLGIASRACSDGGAVPGPPGTTSFYQAKATCGGSEGP